MLKIHNISFKLINETISKIPKKSVQFEPMETSSNEELTDDSSVNDDNDQDMIPDYPVYSTRYQP
jgi:hypothetical protein